MVANQGDERLIKRILLGLLAVVALGIGLTPVVGTATPAFADTAAQCQGGSPGFEYHEYTDVTGISGVYLMSVKYEWMDDCHTVIWATEVVTAGTVAPYVNCGPDINPAYPAGHAGANGESWSTTEWRMRIPHTGYTCVYPQWLTQSSAALEQSGDGVSRDDVITIYRDNVFLAYHHV